MMTCPRCGRTAIRRTRTRGFGERLRKLARFKAFHCVDCHHRVFRFDPSRHRRRPPRWVREVGENGVPRDRYSS